MAVTRSKSNQLQEPRPDKPSNGRSHTNASVTRTPGCQSVRNLNSASDVLLGQLNWTDGSVGVRGLHRLVEKTIIKGQVIKSPWWWSADRRSHINELAQVKHSLSAYRPKNIVSDGLTRSGGRLSSLNGITDFDLQTGWIDMSQNLPSRWYQDSLNKPLQYISSVRALLTEYLVHTLN